jgi:S-adenosylhomocysteine hydrolase
MINTFFSTKPRYHYRRRCKSTHFFSTERDVSRYEAHIPPLPILADIIARFPSLRNIGKNTVLLGVQHMLPTTATLFHTFCDHLGFQARDMFFCGKFYSSCDFVEQHLQNFGIQLISTKTPQRPSQYKEQMEESIKALWDQVGIHLKSNPHIQRVVILDEGGYCLEYMPKFMPYKYEMASVEQTRFGFYNKSIDSTLFPTIDVARSAAKKELESPLIAKAIIRRLSEIVRVLRITPENIMGVIGNGAIGHALVRHLLAKGYKVLVFDENESAFHGIQHQRCYRVDTIGHLIAAADIVLSCTGRDVSQKADILNAVKNSITLVSCSSQNIEFFSLIKQITQNGFLLESIDNDLSQLVYMNPLGEKISVLENGFPINFDRTPKSDPPSDMALTRALLFAGISQALLVAKKPVDDGITINRKICYMLDPYIQQFIVKKWLANESFHDYSQQQIDCFEDINWIKAHSMGTYLENPLFLPSLSSTQSENELSTSFSL